MSLLKKIPKIVYFVAGFIFIIVFSFFFSSYWVKDDIDFYPGKSSEVKALDFSEPDGYSFSLTELSTSDNVSFKSLARDSFITVVFDKPMTISKLSVDAVVRDSDKKTVCQVFFTGSASGGFSETSSTKKEIFDGSFDFDLHDNECGKLRLDLTNEAGTEVEIRSINICRNYTDYSHMPCFILTVIILTLVLYLVLYGSTCEIKPVRRIIDGWNGISERKRSLLLMFAAVGVSVIVVYGKMLVSDTIMVYTDIGSDTNDQYFPYYNYIANKLKEGNTDIWMAEIGVGYSINYLGIFNPLTLLTLLSGALFGSQSLPLLIIIYKAVSALLCAYVCFRFLELFSENHIIVAITAYVYAFNGFSTIWGQHYVFIDYSLYAICVLYFIEKFLRKSESRCYIPLILVSFASMLFSVYMTYIIFIPAAIYAIIRYIQLHDGFSVKDFARKFIHLALNIIIGFLGSFLTAAGSISVIMGSGRVGGSESKLDAFLKYVRQWYITEDVPFSLGRLISGNLTGIGSTYSAAGNYYEAPQLFFSVLFIFLFAQFIFTVHRTSASKKHMVCRYISVLLVFAAVFNKGFGYALYAFAQFSRRSTFALLPFFAIMMLIALENIISKKKISITGFAVGSVVTVYLLLKPFFDTPQGMGSSLRALLSTVLILFRTYILADIIVFLAAAIVLVLLYRSKSPQKTRRLAVLLAVLVGVNVTLESYISVNRNMNLSEDYVSFVRSDTRTTEALDYISSVDNSYYRVDKDYYNWNRYTDSFYQNYKPVTSYNSVMTAGMKQFNAGYLNPLFINYRSHKPTFSASPYDIIPYSVMGLKYILSYSPVCDPAHYELLTEKDGIYVYKNKAADSFTTFYDNVITEEEFGKYNFNEKNRLLQSAMVIAGDDSDSFGDYLKSAKQLLDEQENRDITDIATLNGSPLSSLFGTDFDSVENITLEKGWSEKIEGNAFFELSLMPSADFDIVMLISADGGPREAYRHIIKCKAGKEYQIRYPLPLNASSVTIDFSGKQSTLNYFTINDCGAEIRPQDNPSVIKDEGSDSHLSGTISCDRDGVLFIPIPYDPNWKLKIDGTDAEMFVADSAFIAAKITEGEHSFTLDYESAELKTGIICFTAAVGITAVYYLLSCGYFRRRKKEPQKTGEK